MKTNRLNLMANVTCLVAVCFMFSSLLGQQAEVIKLQRQNQLQAQKLADHRFFMDWVTNRLDKGWSFADEKRYAEDNGFPLPRQPMSKTRPPDVWNRDYSVLKDEN